MSQRKSNISIAQRKLISLYILTKDLYVEDWIEFYGKSRRQFLLDVAKVRKEQKEQA